MIGIALLFWGDVDEKSLNELARVEWRDLVVGNQVLRFDALKGVDLGEVVTEYVDCCRTPTIRLVCQTILTTDA